MQKNIYTLPELTFVGGKTQELKFNLKDCKRNPFNAEGSSADFSVCCYSYKTGEPVFSVIPVLTTAENGLMSKLTVKIEPDKTVNLFGKYIYQLTIIDCTGRVEIPNQGILNITRNINIGFVEGG